MKKPPLFAIASTCITVGAVLVIAALDTGCALKSRHRCSATATYLGKARKGMGFDFEQEAKAREGAVKNLCETYCREEDPDVEAAVIKAAGRPPTSHVERINLVANPPVVAVYTACKARCDAAMPSIPTEQRCTFGMFDP